ncbi:hypothetical protein AcV5_009435 [Taiwanofungus camphoratus]|nr:hypothetical protein AcV5_009435 [Antrodia cinnamomea]
MVPTGHGLASSGSEPAPSGSRTVLLGHGPVPSGNGSAPSGSAPAPSGSGSVLLGHGLVPSGTSTTPSGRPVVLSGTGVVLVATSTSAAGSETTSVPKKKGKKTHLLSTVPLPPFMYDDDDVEVVPLTKNVKKYRESHPIPPGCLVSTIYDTIIDIKRPTKPHPDLTPFEKQRHDLFSPRCPTMTSAGYMELMAIKCREFFADEEFVAVGLSPSQRRLPLPPPSSSSSGSGCSGDRSDSEGQSSGGGLQYEMDSDEDDDDDEDDEDEEGQGQGQRDVIELSSDAGQHGDQMEVDEGQAQIDKSFPPFFMILIVHGHVQAQFTAEGQAQEPDPSDDESVFLADLLRWADEQTETQAAAQLVYAYQHLRVEQVKSADSLQRLTDMRDFNALGVDSVAHVLERYKM